MKVWLADNHTLMDLLKKFSNPSLFDQDKKNFYFSQQSLTIKTSLSKETMKNMKNKLHCIALHCVQGIVSQDLPDKEQIERDVIDKLSHNELSFSLKIARCDYETSINVSQNQSGMVHSTKPAAAVRMQTEFHVGAVKPLRSGFRNFDDSVKTTLALFCSNAGITYEQS